MQKKIFEKISRTFKSTTISRTFECTTNSRTAEVQAIYVDMNKRRDIYTHRMYFV